MSTTAAAVVITSLPDGPPPVLTGTPVIARGRSPGSDPINHLPRFITTPIHDPSRLARISRFRSGVGHDYSDGQESCRSMKHYFQPRDDVDWSSLVIRAPFDGVVTEIEPEWAGDKLTLVPERAPEVRVVIFHVIPGRETTPGARVAGGDALGTHVGSQTMSDVAVWYRRPSGGQRLVSYFSVLTDDAFAAYRAVGVRDRTVPVIPRGARDRAPLRCDADGRFVLPERAGERAPATAASTAIPNWLELSTSGR